MRNEHPGQCYRCGLLVKPKDGHFERVGKGLNKRFFDVLGNAKWLTQHANCAIEYRGTDHHYLIDPAELGPDGKRMIGPRKVACPYCEADCEAVTGADVYPSMPHLAKAQLYWCRPCDARVGCHTGTWVPKGTPAKAPLRRARMAAHAAFDPLWQIKQRRDGCSKQEARAAAYQFLADQLGLDPKDCHIGAMNEAACRRVVDVCAASRIRKAA